MKKATKICTLLLALALAFSLLAMTIFADDTANNTCETTTMNVAPLAVPTATSSHWIVQENIKATNDGHVTTFVPSAPNLRADQFIRYLTFDQTYEFSRIVITTGGVVARYETSKSITDSISGKYIRWEFIVRLYNASNMVVYESEFETEQDGTTEIIFPTPKSGYKLELQHKDCGTYDRNNQAIYEIEMYATVGHEWETVKVTTDPTCTIVGRREAKCKNCEATKTCIVPALGHTANPNNPCDSTCVVCKQANTVAKKHKYSDNCTDLKCDTAGCDGERQEWELPHEWTKQNDTTEICEGCSITRCIHQFDNDCDRVCNICEEPKFSRDAPGVIPDVWHLLDDTCYDNMCNHCEEIVEPPHVYAKVCSTICTVCEHVRTIDDSLHTYGPIYDDENDKYIDETKASCDTVCNVCEETRVAPHALEFPCQLICPECGETNTKAPNLHVYDNACDPDCNAEGCKMKRNTKHVYTNACDAVCDTEGCGHTRTVADDSTFDPDHDYENACDTTCNICGATREVPAHVYDNACDASCNICGLLRTKDTDATFLPDHSYDNGCDTICNVCQKTRTVPDHSFDNDCDQTCNVCNLKIRETTHQYGPWIETVPPERKTEGTQIRNCIICNDQQSEQLPALGGMGAGAVVGIVAGSVAVVGGGGFCLWWFVLKKKFIK